MLSTTRSTMLAACKPLASSSCGVRSRRSWQPEWARSIVSTQRHRSTQPRASNQPVGAVTVPIVSLVCVSFLWATYGPSLRLIFATPGAPEPNVLIALKAIGTTAILWACIPLQQSLQQRNGSATADPSNNPAPPGMAEPVAHTHAESAEAALPATGIAATPNSNVGPRALLPILKAKNSSMLSASLELGFFSGAGSILQAWGLFRVPATTAGFLIHFTTVLTPGLALLAGDRISQRTQIAVAVAFVGTLLTALDGNMHAVGQVAEAGTASTMLGTVSVLGAAGCYSIATYRIGVLAPGFPPLELATAKNLGIAAFAVGFAAVAAALAATSADTASTTATLVEASTTANQAVNHSFVQQVQQTAMSMWPGYGNARCLALVAWTAAGPGALASALQVYGQSSVPASQTQIIFTAIPVWSAIIAVTFLGEEALHSVGIVGAAMIVLAGLSTARASAVDAD